LFRRLKESEAIDIKAVNLMVDTLCRELRRAGRFDAVVMDYVLNSVDSLQAESDVMQTIGAFCKPGGTLFFSGRRHEHVVSSLAAKRKTAKNRSVEFLDANGFSGLFRKGQWFYQKFHSAEQIQQLAAAHGFTIVRETETGTGWQVTAENANIPLPADALSREFNMKLGSSGRTLNRHTDVISALQSKYLGN
jgi:ParB family chromosome partitioning protein